MKSFEGKNILLGVSGSIAAYKAVDLASKLTQAGAAVDVLMTKSAEEFVTPLTFKSITHRLVISNLFNAEGLQGINHIELARKADVFVIAPATANTIFKLAHGQADDTISVSSLATNAPILIAPAMDAGMWENAAVQTNVATLISRGFHFVGPNEGRLASGLSGNGRLSENHEILGTISQILGANGDLAGKKLVVSAGGTVEAIDPVRSITNRSSGKMGYAIAEAARDRGAIVHLVSAPTNLTLPVGVMVTNVRTASEMGVAVLKECENADVLVMAAAVADFKPFQSKGQKIKRGNNKSLKLDLIENPDFFSKVPMKVLRVGFSAETENMLPNALGKLKAKELSLIVANDVSRNDIGFEVDTNQVTIINKEGAITDLPLMTKADTAWSIIDHVVIALRSK